jgi:hypothetical protein
MARLGLPTATATGRWTSRQHRSPQEGSSQQIVSRSVGRDRRERGHEPGDLGDSHESREGRQGIEASGSGKLAIFHISIDGTDFRRSLKLWPASRIGNQWENKISNCIPSPSKIVKLLFFTMYSKPIQKIWALNFSGPGAATPPDPPHGRPW